MLNLIKKLVSDEDGQGITEYILVVLLVALSMIWIGEALSNAIQSFYEGIESAVTPLVSVSPFGSGQWP